MQYKVKLTPQEISMNIVNKNITIQIFHEEDKPIGVRVQI